MKRLSDGQPIRELLMVPATLPRFVRIPGSVTRYVAVETLIRHFTAILFPGYEVLSEGAFRVIRDSDIELRRKPRISSAISAAPSSSGVVDA